MIDNSTQTLFWICSCGLMLILSVIVIAPWLRHKNEKITQSKPQTNLVHLNISIFKERLAELEADYQRKVIETDEYLEQKIDLERQLLAAHMGVINPINRHAESLQSSTNVSRSVRVMLVLTLMFLSFSAYYFWNQHQQVQHRALLDFWANQNQYAISWPKGRSVSRRWNKFGGRCTLFKTLLWYGFCQNGFYCQAWLGWSESRRES
jgi:cytochrome c-type biogenesis protein CcmI